MNCVVVLLLILGGAIPTLQHWGSGGGQGEIGLDLGVTDFESGIAEETDIGYRLAFRGGYRIKERFELEGDLAAALSDDGSACLGTLLVDGVLNFPAGKRAEPYLLAGVGSANLDLDGTDDTGFAYKAGAGARLFPGGGRKVAIRFEVSAVADNTFGETHVSKNLLVGVSW